MSNDLISRSHFDERVRLAAGPDADEEFSADFLDGVKTVLYMLSTEPAASQEMSAVEYLKQQFRMCIAQSDDAKCEGCPLSPSVTGEYCDSYEVQHPEEVVAIVEKWVREHPERSEE